MNEYLYLPDNQDGTYTNPVLFCDYSDPDCICVDGVYYMTASSFNYVPGLPILTSTDLVNWTLRNYAIRNIPVPRFDAPCHAHGVWAPAIRHHDGLFYIYYGQPDEGIYMVRTADPLGEWDAPVLVLPGKGLIDPCPFWDDDGRAYVVHGYAKSRIGFKSWLGIFPMSADGTHAIGDDKLLFDGVTKHPTIEGPKVHKRDGWYYIFAPAGGVATGWQVVLRSRDIHGPYEDRVVLKQGSSDTNGPHQGAWVETPHGEHFFMHFQSRGLYGRITHLQPMTWGADGWPFIGQADTAPVDASAIQAGEDAADAALVANAADCGVPVDTWQKPIAQECAPCGEVGSDDFTGELGLQWQFMANWRPDFYDCGEGTLRLYARQLPHGGTTLWQCPQTCTQKIACPAFVATTTADVSGLKVGEQAGVGLVGGQYAYAALRRADDGLHLVYVISEGSDHQERILDEVIGLPDVPVTFRMTLLPTGYAEAVCTFEYAVDGEFRRIGEPFAPARHTWVGARLALFSMPLDGRADQGGYADFGAFRVEPVETI